MAPSSSQDVPRNQRGKFNSQRSDGSVVIDVPSGFNFVISGAKVTSTGMGRLLAEGLRQNEPLYWTTRESSEGPEMDQIYCDRINQPPRSPVFHPSSDHAQPGGSSPSRQRPYDEPHPYSLNGRRDIESIRLRSLYNDPSYSTSYQERARRSSQAYEQFPLQNDVAPPQTMQGSHNNVPPPYNERETPPPYTSISDDQENEIEDVVPTESTSGHDSQNGGGKKVSFTSLPRRTD